MVNSQLIFVIFTNVLNKNHVIIITVIHYGFIKGQGGTLIYQKKRKKKRGTLMWFGSWWSGG
jgi:hypothetical protein